MCVNMSICVCQYVSVCVSMSVCIFVCGMEIILEFFVSYWNFKNSLVFVGPQKLIWNFLGWFNLQHCNIFLSLQFENSSGLSLHVGPQPSYVSPLVAKGHKLHKLNLNTTCLAIDSFLSILHQRLVIQGSSVWETLCWHVCWRTIKKNTKWSLR